jgi:hypothetical protein
MKVVQSTFKGYRQSVGNPKAPFSIAFFSVISGNCGKIAKSQLSSWLFAG